jgi:hypothetical protein
MGLTGSPQPASWFAPSLAGESGGYGDGTGWLMIGIAVLGCSFCEVRRGWGRLPYSGDAKRASVR